MNPNVFVVRQKKRTLADVHDKFIQPTMATVSQDIGQKIMIHARRNHTFKNRTGALEDSIRFATEQVRAATYNIIITAGGFGKVKFALRTGKLATKLRGLLSSGKPRKIRRRGRVAVDFNPNTNTVTLSGRRSLRKGEVINVNYAAHVERRGYSVLVNSVMYYRERIPRIISRALKGATAGI